MNVRMQPGLVLMCLSATLFWLVTSSAADVDGMNDQFDRLSFLTATEASFVRTYIVPHIPQERSLDPYTSIKRDSIAECKWLLDGIHVKQSEELHPVLIDVLSIGDFNADEREVIQNVVTTHQERGKREFVFIWARAHMESVSPRVIMSATVQIRERDDQVVSKLFRVSRVFENRDGKWGEVACTFHELARTKEM